MFVPPMLASPMPKPGAKKPFILEPGIYCAEEKYDGMRLLTEITKQSGKLFVPKGITAWSRYGNVQDLPSHLEEELAKFPDCIIDGELAAPGLRSYGTMAHANSGQLVYYLFDIVEFEGIPVTALTYAARRSLLQDLVVNHLGIANLKDGDVCLSDSRQIDTWDQLYAFRDEVWARDGEGLILKERSSEYLHKRSKKWVKIKKCQIAAFVVTGFVPSRGEINNRGPYAIVKLRDGDGINTTVKTKNDEQCRKFEEEGRLAEAQGKIHPAIGRTLICEYQERTPDNEYREIRWDRWENE